MRFKSEYLFLLWNQPNVRFPSVLYSVLSTRVLFNIRAAAELGDESEAATELHTGYQGRDGRREFPSSIAFRLDDVSRETGISSSIERGQ